MKNFELEIITPSKVAFKGMVNAVTVPGTLGSFQILFNHAPLLSTFEVGRIKIKQGELTSEFTTGGGTVEVLENRVLILADSFESKDEIDIERAKGAYQRAKERLRSHSNDIDIKRAEAALARAINRLKFTGSL
ncbi:F0F1 ATP synthase subunit epsilon [Melioribacter sp. OK-6-Me]|uniref:F0F1 ATP synthase subunit epsilon n=1 Tax=unclassified Melioribacter TaxID=2627329 RepID=UPI003ED9C258